jgi:hypothetical protein
MADDTKHAPQGSKFLGLEQDWEAKYWAKRFGISRESLGCRCNGGPLGGQCRYISVGAYLNEYALAHQG